MKGDSHNKKQANSAAESGSRRKCDTDNEGIKPRPAYRAFKLEDEWVGKNLLRSLAMSIYGYKDREDVYHDSSILYQHAIGKPPPWRCIYDNEGVPIRKEKRHPIPPLEAAEELIKLALDAVTYVELLRDREPDLCRQIATRLPHWPISADLTLKDWKRRGEKIIAEVGLGSGIDGFLKSARTSDENPIRLYATAIYETLFQTRGDFKRAKDSVYATEEGCPEWAKKTLGLPRYTKAGVSAWMKLGKEMLLEQHPEFLEDDLLREQSYKWKKRAVNRSRSGKPTLRAIQNEAFDDFSKEMKKLAPAENIYRGKW